MEMKKGHCRSTRTLEAVKDPSRVHTRAVSEPVKFHSIPDKNLLFMMLYIVYE